MFAKQKQKTKSSLTFAGCKIYCVSFPATLSLVFSVAQVPHYLFQFCTSVFCVLWCHFFIFFFSFLLFPFTPIQQTVCTLSNLLPHPRQFGGNFGVWSSNSRHTHAVCGVPRPRLCAVNQSSLALLLLFLHQLATIDRIDSLLLILLLHTTFSFYFSSFAHLALI